MRRDLLAAARFLIVPTVVLAVVVAFLPGRVGLVVRIYALILCAAVLGVALAALRRAYPPSSPLRGSRSAPTPRRPPPSLARLEQVTALGVAGAFDLHHRLRPRLRRTAVGLFAVRRRSSLDADPEASRAVLGDETWDLVQRNRTAPEDRLAHGVSPSALARVIDSLERI